MTVAESKNLRKGSRVCWLGYAADSGRRCWAFVGLLRGERKARGGEPSGWDSLRRAHTDGAGNHRPAYLIRTEIVDALNRQ